MTIPKRIAKASYRSSHSIHLDSRDDDDVRHARQILEAPAETFLALSALEDELDGWRRSVGEAELRPRWRRLADVPGQLRRRLRPVTRQRVD